MKRFFIGFAFLASLPSYSQNIGIDALLQLDSLIFRLHQSLSEQKDIEVSEIKGVYKLTFWHFVPSLNYDFINNKYYFTISSSAFVSNMISKRQERRRLSSIDRRYTLLEKNSELKLKSLYSQLLHRLTDLKLSFEIVTNDIEIFKIRRQEHTNNEIDTESFLTSRSSILNKIKSHNSDVSDIQKFMFDIEQLTSFSFDLDLLPFYVSPLDI